MCPFSSALYCRSLRVRFYPSQAVTLLHPYYESVRLPDNHLHCLSSSDCAINSRRGSSAVSRISHVPAFSLHNHTADSDSDRDNRISPFTIQLLLPSERRHAVGLCDYSFTELNTFTCVAVCLFPLDGFTGSVTLDGASFGCRRVVGLYLRWILTNWKIYIHRQLFMAHGVCLTFT